MAVPKKKTAKSRTRVRHTAFVKKTQKKIMDRVCLSTCSNCGEKRLAHHACASCGFYNGREVVKQQKAEVTRVQA
ncbi:MAG: 50S ribosomal protein L32 [Candidatus Gracilibacteria bacterium]|jgi:large subunit ribosomal protein L32|nr:50S ribosomal protein L32 [Candidatus Gracilibacteria bacterium]